MIHPVDTWFQREQPVPPCRCCGLVGAHCDQLSKPAKPTPETEPKDLIAATNEANLPDFLTSNVALCQPVGTLPALSVCSNDTVEPHQQKVTVM